jgi:hypothetical protein
MFIIAYHIISQRLLKFVPFCSDKTNIYANIFINWVNMFFDKITQYKLVFFYCLSLN